MVQDMIGWHNGAGAKEKWQSPQSLPRKVISNSWHWPEELLELAAKRSAKKGETSQLRCCENDREGSWQRPFLRNAHSVSTSCLKDIRHKLKSQTSLECKVGSMENSRKPWNDSNVEPLGKKSHCLENALPNLAYEGTSFGQVVPYPEPHVWNGGAKL